MSHTPKSRCLLLALAVASCFLVIAAEGKMKEDWRNKKSHYKSLMLKGDRSRSTINTVDAKDWKKGAPEMFGRSKLRDFDFESGLLSKKKSNRKRGRHGRHNKHKNAKNAGFKKLHQKADRMRKLTPWSEFIRPEMECEPKCGKHRVCVVGPVGAQPHCVHFKDLKRSLKKFLKYQKREKKAWKKFHKKSQKYFHKQGIIDFSGKGKFNDKTLQIGRLDLEEEVVRKQKELRETVGRRPAPAVIMAPTEAGYWKGCTTGDFLEMRNRIMGWFHLLRSHNKRAMKEERRLKGLRHSVKKQLDAGDKCQCMKSAMWEFRQMDSNEDDHLTDEEMSLLEGNVLEPCMKPYLTSCDLDANGHLSSAEWCCCFSNVLGPCYRKMDEIRRTGKSGTVNYMPRCDKEGYYMSEQCQRTDDKKFECWCVDYNGNYTEGTKTEGRAQCNKFD